MACDSVRLQRVKRRTKIATNGKWAIQKTEDSGCIKEIVVVVEIYVLGSLKTVPQRPRIGGRIPHASDRGSRRRGL